MIARALALILVAQVSASCGADSSSGPAPEASVLPGRIAFQSTRLTGTPDIFVMDPDGANVQPVVTGLAVDQSPSLSPDGTRIAFGSDRDHSGRSVIYTVNVDGSGLRRVTSDTFAEGNPAWSPDGTKILFVRSSHTNVGAGLFVVNADGSGLLRLRLTGWEAAWSPDGSRIAFVAEGVSSTANSIYLMNPDGSAVAELVNGFGSIGDPAWSPDGSRIAFGGVSNNQEIFVMNADGTNRVNFTNTPDPAGEIQPAWSPDGEYLVFTGFRNGNQEIVRRKADGSGEVVLTHLGAKDFHPSWSRVP